MLLMLESRLGQEASPYVPGGFIFPGLGLVYSRPNSSVLGLGGGLGQRED